MNFDRETMRRFAGFAVACFVVYLLLRWAGVIRTQQQRDEDEIVDVYKRFYESVKKKFVQPVETSLVF